MSDEPQSSLADSKVTIRATDNVHPFDPSQFFPKHSPTVYRRASSRVRAETAQSYHKMTVENPAEDTKMAEFTRGEFDARLEAAEERTNARLAGIEAQLGILTNKIDVWTTHANEAKSEVSELRKAVYSQKWAIIFAVITTGFAVVGLIYGIMAYGLESMAVAISIVTERGNQ